MELSDQEIINKCLSGDVDSFSLLVTRYKKLVHKIVFSMVKDTQDVNDISQEVFIRVYQNLNKYNSQFKFSTWISKITTNYCLDTFKKKKFNQVPIDEVVDLSAGNETPESEYIKKEKTNSIRKIINDLPDMYRLPIMLFHNNGLSYEEITKVLNQPMSIVKNRIYRARQMLKDKIFPNGRKEGKL